jgi:hypothetical protein
VWLLLDIWSEGPPGWLRGLILVVFAFFFQHFGRKFLRWWSRRD